MATNSICLVNYHPLNSEPLKSITRFSKKEAFEIAQKLYEENHVPGYERFGPGFESYYTLRMETEKWLYEEFIAIGGKPQTTHPLYFFVHDWDVVHKLWSVKIAEKIALDEIKVLDKGIIKQLKIQGPTYDKTPPLEMHRPKIGGHAQKRPLR